MSWTLDVDRGRQTWRYSKEVNPNPKPVDGTFCPKGCNMTPAKSPQESITKAVQYFTQVQTEDGHWAGDYGGPMFLLPGLVITCYVTGYKLPEPHVQEIIRYLLNRQNPKDGGWGLHIEAHSDIFGTALQYVSLRLLGLPVDHPGVERARKFLRDNGGATGIPSWGKFWLATLNVYSWDGLNPIPIEFWLLPYSVPICPGRWWCHCRMVYLPMSYLYARRTTAAETPLIRELRKELYVTPYSEINWPAQRDHINKLDMYAPHSYLLKSVNGALNLYERMHSKWLRDKAIDFTFDHIRFEDEQTKYIDIGPVNKTLNMLVVWDREGQSPNFFKHADRLYDYLWLASDGMKMQGYNGSQLWDTAFTIQAFVESGISHQFPEAMRMANHYLDITQVPDNAPDGYFRHISKGAWPFSTVDHGWPISDCTAEGIKAALALRSLPNIVPISLDRVAEGVNVILSLQNSDGGWASYENKRGPNWLELFNPSEVFQNIMIDYSYVECSAACIQAMSSFLKHAPEHPRAREIRRSIDRGIKFIKSIQRDDGSWLGSWGICFTYGTWFGVEGLVASGEPLNSPHLVKACKFLISKQREDGGWGESFRSNVTKNYVQHEQSQIVNTGWALLSLMAAKYPDREPIERGIKYLISKQYPNGDFPQESIIGVFNFNCMISYSNYKNIFPLWAISRYNNIYLKSKI
ncbi:cycloartenol synthase [Heterostelium album PN500]|uniref:Terpene cyclase/mutase family member n=1 Tax=Heterostelium pallidum (strain ATCC 26659 / Pp 5 / PN500) TaxID=670386 RepID=D3BC24_HETP5|nr:cycloartenol synthase [Heterostelium album PN500]EFA81207.1 cycloartenol synthase [Heterostelium album PN500]|eukprot:XP_020433325.1 cycloartenol synthase [Heterostelium album PN500]